MDSLTIDFEEKTLRRYQSSHNLNLTSLVDLDEENLTNEPFWKNK